MSHAENLPMELQLELYQLDLHLNRIDCEKIKEQLRKSNTDLAICSDEERVSRMLPLESRYSALQEQSDVATKHIRDLITMKKDAAIASADTSMSNVRASVALAAPLVAEKVEEHVKSANGAKDTQAAQTKMRDVAVRASAMSTTRDMTPAEFNRRIQTILNPGKAATAPVVEEPPFQYQHPTRPFPPPPAPAAAAAVRSPPALHQAAPV